MTLSHLTKAGMFNPTKGLNVKNINTTGIITATSGSFSGNVTAVDGIFSGNVSIAGTLTYEDVTNIDSVGIITARGDLDVDGHTNLDNISIAGVTTITAGAFGTNLIVGARHIATNIDIPSTSLRTGVVIRNANDYRTDSGFNGGFQVLDPYDHSATSFAFRAAEGTTLVDNAWIKCNGTAYFANRVGIGITEPTQSLDVNGKIRVFGSDGSAYGLWIDPSSTGGTYETLIGKANGDLRLQAGAASYSAGSANILLKNSNDHIIINAANSGNVGIGTDNAATKLTVFSDDSVTDTDVFQVRSKSGAFNIRVSDSDAANPEWALRTYANEPIVFMQGTVERLRITSGGHIKVPDNTDIQIGNATNGDLKIYHDTNDSYIQDVGSGQLRFLSNDYVFYNAGGNENLLRITENTGVSLYDGADTVRLATNDSGVDVTGILTSTSGSFGPGILEESYMNDTGGGIVGNYNHDVLSYGMVWYGVTNAVGGWTFNIRGNSSTTFNSISNTNKVTTMTIYSANNNAANYMSAFNIDGVTQTIKWAGGSAPSVATGSGVDVYSMTIMKTGAGTYHVFGNFTNFA